MTYKKSELVRWWAGELEKDNSNANKDIDF